MPMVRRPLASGYSADGVSVKIRRKARADWLALMPNAHEGYVSWERAEAIRTMVSSNVPTGRHHGAPKHGDALLAGLIRCNRCGRKLTLRTQAPSTASRATAAAGPGWTMAPLTASPSADLRVDDAIEEALLGVVGPGAIAAATAAAEAGEPSGGIRCARPSAATSKRRATPPTAPSGNTMPPTQPIGWSLANWRRAGTGRSRMWRRSKPRSPHMMRPCPLPPSILPRSVSLASNLKTVWSAPTTDARLKKRIVRTLIHEVVADIDDAAAEIVLIVHWIGGAHSEMRLPKRRRGQRNSTSADIDHRRAPARAHRQ